MEQATAQFDSIGKMLNVSVDRNQSPIDIVPVITAFGEHLQNAEFRYSRRKGERGEGRGGETSLSASLEVLAFFVLSKMKF